MSRQVGPGRLAELHQIVHAALADVLVHFMQAEIVVPDRSLMMLMMICSAAATTSSDETQAHAPDQGIEADHSRRHRPSGG